MTLTPSHSFEVNEPTVISETIDGETVVINLTNGCYYSLKNSGSVIWAGIQKSARLDEIAEMVRANFEVNGHDVEQEVFSLVGRLIEEDLVRPALEHKSVNGLVDASGLEELASFRAPVLEKFTDLEALLLLDPVHDVDEKGWPNLGDQGRQLDD
jgi:hypothetical protein